MIHKSLLATALLIATSSAVFAAPRTPAKAKRTVAKPAPKKSVAQKPAAKAPTSAPQYGVNITPIMRNRSMSAVTVQLAKDGKALLPIIVSEKASKSTLLVANELAEYLKRMSGATFEVKSGDGSSGIVLGSMAEFPVPALSKALEIRHGFEGKEAYAIRARENRVLLLGATDLGASHAAYRFLEELGCRWFFPAKEWTVVPSIPDLKFNLDITDRPMFLSRSIWYGWWFFTDDGHPDSTPENPKNAQTDYNDWSRRNAHASSFIANTGHAYETIARERAAEFEKHPEYWALVDGKRQGPQFELGNPGLRKLVVDWAVEYFKKNPDADMVSVDPADGYGVSQSEEAKAYGNASDSSFKLANEVAVALQKAYPGQNKMVGLYAYNWHTDPPPFALEPNVYVQLTMGFIGGKLNLYELLEEWPKRAKNFGFYDYYSVWRWDADRWPGGRIASKKYPIEMFGRFQKANLQSGAYATSISAESSNNWGPHGRGYYLANKMMWNPDLDVEATLEDFYQKAFVPAAAAMKKYYAMWDDPPPLSPGVIGQLFRYVDEASKAAKDHPDVQLRLDQIKNYLGYEYLNFRRDREGDAAKKDELLQQIWTLTYRTRYSYMNHWRAIHADWIKPQPGHPTPWQVEKPMTREETQQLFNEGLAYFPELRIPPQSTFSTQYVPVNVSGKASAFKSPWYQGGTRVLLYSVKGEPLRMKLTGGKMYGGTKHAYEIKDVNEKVVASAKFTSENVQDLTVKVPLSGLYYLDYIDGGNDTWMFEIPSSQVMAFQLKKAATNSTLYESTPDLHFYVPKGTKTIEYYFIRTPWSNSGPHTVIDPEGNIQATFLDKNGDYISIPVPPGMDGKAWRFGSPKDSNQGFGLGQFWFFNVPNVLAPSPAHMLLPKDVVQEDGLQVLK